MEIKTKKINKNDYCFINDYWDRYNAWGHKTTLFKNDRELITVKIRYYNRTWEYYTYQSCMYKAIENYIDLEQTRYINNYKYLNNIDRLTKKLKENVINQFQETETYKDIKKLKQAIDNNNFSYRRA